MRVATRFSIAVHILSLLGFEVGPEKTSEVMATSIGINAVVVRNVTGMLRAAGLVQTTQGRAGAWLTRPLDQITLLDVFRAVETDAELFAMHQRPLPDCPVGAHIQVALEDVFQEAQKAMEDRLASTTMQDIVSEIMDLANSAGLGAAATVLPS